MRHILLFLFLSAKIQLNIARKGNNTNMHNHLLETTNSASKDFPFIDTHSRQTHFFPHTHDEIEIMVIISGELSFSTAEDGIQTANSGDMCIFMPHQIHGFSSDSSDIHMYILKLHSRNSREDVNFNLLRFKNSVLRKNDPFNAILRKHIDKLCQESQDEKTGYGYVVNSLSNLIISEILRSDHLITLDTHYEKQVFSSAKLLSDVNQYISQHYTESIYLEDLARYCHFSKYYFAHQFKEIANMTFYDYLTSYRLDSAKNLLLNTNSSINEIASLCGFTNTRSFNRAFKDQTHCTPSEFKKQAKIKQ